MGTVDAPDVYTRVPVDESQSSPEASSEELCGESSAHRRVSLAYIYVLCVASFGINVAWALEFATVTPFFESGLGATDFVSHAVWIVGPLSGLIVAPIVGALSDSCTSRFGRRRPFIVAGMVATVVGMLCFSSAREIAAWAFPPTTSANAHSLASLIIAMSAFCILDLAINTTMWPVRALQGDLLPPIEQHRVQSASVVLGSLGDLAANALIDSFDQPLTHIRFCYFVAALVYTCSVMVLLVIGREEPLDPDAAQTQNAPSNIFSYLRSIPGWLWRIGGTYALGFFTLFCAMPYASSWLGSSVLGGTYKFSSRTSFRFLHQLTHYLFTSNRKSKSQERIGCGGDVRERCEDIRQGKPFASSCSNCVRRGLPVLTAVYKPRKANGCLFWDVRYILGHSEQYQVDGIR